MSTASNIPDELPGDITSFDDLIRRLEKGMYVLVYRTIGWEYAQVHDIYIANPKAHAYSYAYFNNEVSPEGVHSSLTLTAHSHDPKYDGWAWRVRIVSDSEVTGKEFSYSFLG